MSSWVLALAWSETAYEIWTWAIASIPGRLFVVGWLLSLYYHLANGVRHLLWDLGYFLELSAVYLGGKVVVAVSALLTVLTLIVLYGG